PGDISAPVQTEYGFHIIKLIKKEPIAPYDSMLAQLKAKIEKDSRSQRAQEIFFEKVKAKNGFKEFPENMEELTQRLSAIPDTGKDANMFHASDFKDLSKTIFALGGTNYTQRDFISFAENLTRGRLMAPRDEIGR